MIAAKGGKSAKKRDKAAGRRTVAALDIVVFVVAGSAEGGHVPRLVGERQVVALDLRGERRRKE